MGINMTDQSGTPRSDEDLQEAIDTVKKQMISRTIENPMLEVMLPTIIECLTELQGFRELVKKIKAKQKSTSPTVSPE